MTRYLISFDAHAMDHIPEVDGPAVGKAAHEVVQDAVNAGVALRRRAGRPASQRRGDRWDDHRRPEPGGRRSRR